MTTYQLQSHSFTSEREGTKNFLEFHVINLTSVRLGKFIIAVNSSLHLDKNMLLMSELYDAIDRFATSAQPLTYSDALEKLFAHINSFATDRYEPSEISQLNISIMHLKDEMLQFSLHGEMHILLIRKTKMFDMVRMTFGIFPKQKDKLFSRIYSGSIRTGDHLFVTSAETWNFFNTEKLPDIIKKLPLASAAEFLKNALPLHTPYKLGGLIVSFTPVQQKVARASIEDIDPLTSINKLRNTEKQTSRWLYPSPLLHIKKTAARALSLSARLVKKRSPKIPLSPHAKPAPFYSNKKQRVHTRREHSLDVPPRSRKLLLAKSAARASNGITKGLYRATSTAYHFCLHFPKNARYSFDKFLHRFKKWPKTTKWLFFLALLLITLFTQSVYTVYQKKEQSKANTYFEELSGTIQTLYDEADQAIIFRDYERARSLLAEAQNLITQLPVGNDDRARQKKEMEKLNEEKLAKANRSTIVAQPLALLNASEKLSETPTHLSWAGGRLFISTKNRLASLDPAGLELSTVVLPSSIKNIHFIQSGGQEESNANLLIFHDSNRITEYIPEKNEFITLNETITVTPDAIQDVSLYKKRLYRLDTSQNQIWRHLRFGDSFQSPSAWLKDGSDLSDARGLAIDGTVYVLGGEPQLSQYLKGRKTDWRAESIVPDLSGATGITTFEDSPYLYILDPPQLRLIIYDKNGALVQQFISPQFDRLVDMAIVEQEGHTITYLLNNGTVYSLQFSLEE